jgi:hypothetical protein
MGKNDHSGFRLRLVARILAVWHLCKVEGRFFENEIIFEAREDVVDGGYTAHAPGYGIHSQGGTADELRAMVRAAVSCWFDDSMEVPKIGRVHFGRDEVLAAL